MTKKKKRRLRLKMPELNFGEQSSSSAPRKRRRRRFRLKKEAYYVLAAAAVLLALIFVPRIIDNNNLRKLGYDRETIKEIRKQKLKNTILKNNWYSNYLAQAIKNGTLNKDYIQLYTVTVEQRGLNDNDFLLYNRLKDKGYTEEQLIKLYHELKFYELTPLLVFDYQEDETAYIEDCHNNQPVNNEEHFELDGEYYTMYGETRPVDDVTNVNMLINKTYYLDSSYVPENLTELSNYYAAPDRDLARIAADGLANWCNAGRDNDVYFYATSAYRPYSAQEELYEGYVNAYGQDSADGLSARAGFSEHQSGFAVDLAATHEDAYSDFSQTRAYKWAIAHCWEYGWILRYPPGKYDITGYDYESWHFRYLGTQLATAVHNSGLTYDEFYCLYLKPWDDEANKPKQEILDATDYQKNTPLETPAPEGEEEQNPEESPETSDAPAEETPAEETPAEESPEASPAN